MQHIQYGRYQTHREHASLTENDTRFPVAALVTYRRSLQQFRMWFASERDAQTFAESVRPFAAVDVLWPHVTTEEA